MPPFTLGDLVLLEIALAKFLKDIDFNMEAGQQCSVLIGKIEIEIRKIKLALGDQQPPDMPLPDPLNPDA